MSQPPTASPSPSEIVATPAHGAVAEELASVGEASVGEASADEAASLAVAGQDGSASEAAAETDNGEVVKELPVANRRRLRTETLEILDDPEWPGDGAGGPAAAHSAMWWCIGAALLLAFPRQYIAALGAVALALVFRFWPRPSKEETTPSVPAADSTS